MTTVAIDGPAGAGKSSVARAVAAELGFRYIDTGAMYRAVALAALERGVDPDDGTAVSGLLRAIKIQMGERSVHLDGREITNRLRGKEVTAGAARVARHEVVRSSLVALQRELASSCDVVMEGRDIGSAVIPEAEVKIFLTASLDERARRRREQLGISEDSLAEIQRDIERRDRSDMDRPVSPLIQAADAEVIDTTGMSLDQVVAEIAELVRRKAGQRS